MGGGEGDFLCSASNIVFGAGGGVFCCVCIKRFEVPAVMLLVDNVPEVLLGVVDKLEVGSGFFPIPTGCCRVILVWMEFTGEFHVSSSNLTFRHNLIHGKNLIFLVNP